MHEPIYVIGDSHTRAFVNNGNFVPLFVDQGKKLNFVSDENFRSTLAKIKAVIDAADISKAMLYLAEPDTRKYLGKGWQPWKKEGPYDLVGWEHKAQKTSDRYIRLLKEIRPLVAKLAVLSIALNERPEQNEIADYINGRVRDGCEELDVSFIDISEEVGADLAKYCGDPVHLNDKIQPLVERKLIVEGFISDSKFSSSQRWVADKIKKQFKYNERFGCYTLR